MRALPEAGGATADISVIVVNYGTAELAVAAVESVLASDTGGYRVDVHLVDNASPGGDAARFAEAARARAWGDRVTLYPETCNHGFGRGNNLVLKALAARPAPPRFVFLLNPDAQLRNAAIPILARYLEAHPGVAFAGAGIERPGSGPVTAAFRFPRPVGEFSRRLAFGPVTRLMPGLVSPLPPDHPQGPVDWVAGAAVMIRLDVLEALGHFDPEYFLYFEEVDLMQRAARAGWQTAYVPAARVAHLEGAATQVSSHARGRPRRPAYWYRSWRKYYKDNYGVSGLWIAALCTCSGAMGNIFLARIRGRAANVPESFFSDFWRMVWRPLIGLVEKPYA